MDIGSVVYALLALWYAVSTITLLRQGRQNDDVERNLEEPVRGHQKRSGASSATNR